jgi:4-amino-4-deoxy-L-arabinose transferase-like glycosyltransferase
MIRRSLSSFNLLTITPRSQSILAHLLVLVLLAVPVFGHLDELPLETFDEMRLAVNALEMSRSGDLIVTTFEHNPEQWNTKPPLLPIIQAIFLKVFGYNDLAVRLPSAISAALCCLLVMRFIKRRTGSWLPGIIAAFLLLTSGGFIGPHASRTGDYDSLLALCITASFLWLAEYIDEGKSTKIIFSAVALTAAALTKGIAGLFFCPAMVLYIVLRGKASDLLKNRSFWLSLASGMIVVCGYYALREVRQPGYLGAVVDNEISTRYMTVMEAHGGDSWTYYDWLRDHGFVPWFYLLIPATIAAIIVRDKGQARIALLCGLAAINLYIVLTLAGTKLVWYLVPIYPFLAIFCGLLVWQVCQLLLQSKTAAAIWKVNLLPLLLLLIIGTNPYNAVLDQAIHTKKEGEAWDAKTYTREALEGRRTFVADHYCGEEYPLTWYRELLKLKGEEFGFVLKDSIKMGMNVMAWQEQDKKHIRDHYKTSVADSFRNVLVFHINSPWQALDTMHEVVAMNGRHGIVK